MPALPFPGSLIGGKYRIVRLIGEGGMGAVFEARHEHLGSTVALKFLHPDLAERPGLVARFLQEARVSASIKSPYVTQVMDVDQTPDGAAYLVMELLEGETLEQRLSRSGSLPLLEAIGIGIQTLTALEAAHAHGVVHRDLKPDNVWLSPSPSGPHVKLLDFGIAKLKSSDEFRQVETRPGSMMGTPAYMAPEQAISADQVDARADLYSFGVILYEMLSGARPVEGEDPSSILEKLVRGEVHPLATRNPGLPPALCALVDRLVAPDPDNRPASASYVRGELSRYIRTTNYIDGRGSNIPPTVPPDNQGTPPFVTSQQVVAPARITTDSMPKMPNFVNAPTAVATAPPVHAPVHVPVARRRGATGPVLLTLLLAALGGAGTWAYMNQSIFDDSALPPLPGPAPTAAASIEHIDIDLPNAFEVVPQRPRQTQASQTKPPAGPQTSTPGSTAPTAYPQIPPFTLPSSFALPSSFPPISFPSSLPPFLQQLPGFASPPAPNIPPPAAPTTAPSTTDTKGPR